MSITLRPEHEKAISQAIQSGAYQSSDQVIERALELLRSEDAFTMPDMKAVLGSICPWVPLFVQSLFVQRGVVVNPALNGMRI
jgi:hypothetical protein